ncbi:MAG: type IV pilus secretin PilQ [Deltaproteobacteria bacterium]|nr:type IV pilus secretin PilQ [Deltaproteobacteria bacterium]
MNTSIVRFKKSAVVVTFLIVLLGLSGGCVNTKPVANDASGEWRATGTIIISEVMVTEDAQSCIVRVKGNSQLSYTSVKQDFPLGILFYFRDTGVDSAVAPQVALDNTVIESVEFSQISESQGVSRLFIALKEDTPHEVVTEETGIRIEFAKPLAAPIVGDSQSTPDGPAAAATTASRLEGVYIVKDQDRTRLNVMADGTIKNFKSFILYDPARIVFDMPNLKSPHIGEQVIPANTGWIRQTRYYGYADKVRLVIDTEKSYLKNYTAWPSTSGMMIQIGDEPQAAVSAAAEKPLPEVKPIAEKPVAAVVSVSPPAETEVTAAGAEKEAWVNRIDFLSEEAGQSTIIVGTTRPVKYELKNSSATLLQLELFDTKLPKYRDRPLITTRFESAVNRITPVYKKSMPKTTLVAIELREAVNYDVEQKDDVLMIHFGPSSVAPQPLEQANLPDWKKVLAQTEAGSQTIAPAAPQRGPNASPTPPAITAPAAQSDASEPAMPMAALASYKAPNVITYGSHKVYTGEKIALDFYETDIKNVFRIIREISGKNFAIDKDVTGNVTLTLEKPVPWDQVLDLVLKMNRLGMVYEGDIIRIATLATLTAEEKAKQDKITAEQKSQEVVKALEPLVTEYIAVNYSDAQGEVLPLAQKVLTKDRGSISVDQRNNQLIVTDTVSTIAQIKEIVSRIDTVTPQVIIEARVVEVSEEFSMELGIDWNASWGPTNILGGSQLGGNVAMNFPSNASSTVGFNFAKLAGTPLTLDATLNAVEANKQGRIITAPKIVTLDNKKAKIKQGVEWPYLERDSSGNATVKFKNIDLLLEVTPTVTPDDRILMKIYITKNDIGTITLGVPSLNVNEAQTELLVNDSDTIVIGGIIKNNKQESESGWPGVKDIPLMGWMFKTKNENNTNNELLIFITPRIVQLEQRRII